MSDPVSTNAISGTPTSQPEWQAMADTLAIEGRAW